MRSSESTIGHQIITVFFKQILKKYLGNLLTFWAVSTKLCKAVLRGKSTFIFLFDEDILVPGLGAEWGGLLSVSGSSCADGRSCCSQMFVAARLPEGCAPSDPQVELFFWAAGMCLAGAKGANEQFVLIWPAWPGGWDQLHEWDVGTSRRNSEGELRAVTFHSCNYSLCSLQMLQDSLFREEIPGYCETSEYLCHIGFDTWILSAWFQSSTWLFYAVTSWDSAWTDL